MGLRKRVAGGHSIVVRGEDARNSARLKCGKLLVALIIKTRLQN